MPAGCDTVSPIRRPRAFARALGAMVAEQAGPRGRIFLLRNTVEGRTFCTPHKSQTVYHGAVAYLDHPRRHLEAALSDLELALLLVFAKHPAGRAQREYRFLVRAENGPAEDIVDLDVSRALVEAMWKPPPEPEDSGFVQPGAAEYSVVEELRGGANSLARVETLPGFLRAGNPAVALPPCDDEAPPGGPTETPMTGATVEALREAVDRADPGCRKDAPAAAWHAEPVLRFLRVTLVGAIAALAGERGRLHRSRPNRPGTTRSRRASPWRPRGRLHARSAPPTRILRPRRPTPGRSSGLSRGAWRRSACPIGAHAATGVIPGPSLP